MNIPAITDLPPGLVAAVINARQAVRLAEENLSREILSRVGLAKGDVVEDPDSGHRYRVTSAYASVGEYGERLSTHVHIRGYRTWKTGRKAGREAMSESSISVRCEKVTA